MHFELCIDDDEIWWCEKKCVNLRCFLASRVMGN